MPYRWRSTLVHPQWVLTAAHAAQHITERHQASFAGRDYPIQRIVLHPTWKLYWALGNARHHVPFRYVVDLGLVELSKPVLDVEPIPLYERDDELGRTAIFVGRGSFGTGLTGPIEADDHLRGATNRIDKTHKRWLTFCFDAPPHATSLEGISGDGDSGGPAFIEMGKYLYLAGVSSWQDNSDQGAASASCLADDRAIAPPTPSMPTRSRPIPPTSSSSDATAKDAMDATVVSGSSMPPMAWTRCPFLRSSTCIGVALAWKVATARCIRCAPGPLRPTLPCACCWWA